MCFFCYLFFPPKLNWLDSRALQEIHDDFSPINWFGFNAVKPVHLLLLVSISHIIDLPFHKFLTIWYPVVLMCFFCYLFFPRKLNWLDSKALQEIHDDFSPINWFGFNTVKPVHLLICFFTPVLHTTYLSKQLAAFPHRQSYHCSQFTYSCFLDFFTPVLHTTYFSKQLAAFPHRLLVHW